MLIRQPDIINTSRSLKNKIDADDPGFHYLMVHRIRQLAVDKYTGCTVGRFYLYRDKVFESNTECGEVLCFPEIE